MTQDDVVYKALVIDRVGLSERRIKLVVRGQWKLVFISALYKHLQATTNRTTKQIISTIDILKKYY